MDDITLDNVRNHAFIIKELHTDILNTSDKNKMTKCMEYCNRVMAFTDKLDNATLMPIKKDIIHVYIAASDLLFNSLESGVKREVLNKTERNTLQLSINYAEKVLSIEPDNQKGYLLYKNITLYLTDYVDTAQNQLDLLNTICNINPFDHDIYYKIAYIYNIKQRIDDAIKHYKLAIASISMQKNTEEKIHIKYLLELSSIYRERDDYLRAEYYLSKALAINHLNPDIQIGYGLLYNKLNMMDKAIFHFKYALKEQLKTHAALYYVAKIHAYLGNAYAKTNDINMALKEYNKALLYLPDLEDALDGKAKLSKILYNSLTNIL